MKTLIIILFLGISATAQQSFPSYDHNGDHKRVKRTTPRLPLPESLEAQVRVDKIIKSNPCYFANDPKQCRRERRRRR